MAPLNTRTVRVALLLGAGLAVLLLSSLIWAGWIPSAREIVETVRDALFAD